MPSLQELQRQSEVIQLLLDAAEANPAVYRCDLPIAAAKLRHILDAIGKLPWPHTAEHLRGSLFSMIRKWVGLYFGEDAAALITQRPKPPDRAVASMPEPQTAAALTPTEQAALLDALDDLGIFLLSHFSGPPHPQRLDGRWIVPLNDLQCDAALLRAEYAECSQTLLDDFLLLSAASSGLRISEGECGRLAALIAPAIFDALTLSPPAVVVWRGIGRTMAAGLLHTDGAAHRPPVAPPPGCLNLSEAGHQRAQAALPRWFRCSDKSGWGQQAGPEEEIPF